MDLATWEGVRDYAMFRLYLETASRRDAVRLLRIRDLERHEHNRLKVTFARVKGGGTKSFVLGIHTSDALRHAIAAQYPEGFAGDYAVFTAKPKRHLPISAPVVRELSLLYFGTGRLHSLRKTATRQYLEKNPNNYEGAKQMLGHADWGTFHRYLDKLNEEMEGNVQ